MFKKIKNNLKKIIIFLSLLFLLFYFLSIFQNNKKNKNLEVSFIDSGQADSILIQTPSHHNIIIDFGGDQGLEELNKKIPWWNKKIDLIIITHPHDDHILGITSIIKKFQVKKIMYSGILHYSPAYLELLNIIKEKNTPLVIPRENQLINLGEKCSMSIIFPWESFYNKEIENLNNSSIVSKLDCNNSTFLFMGDAEIEVENKILDKNININSDVLKVGHHGSITSSQKEFLEKVNPQIAIIMVGKNNKFNHPNLRTIRKIEKLKIEILRTDINKTITIISDGNKIYRQ